ncbi:MAG: EamA family transporter [Dokdonella sp.]|uniref:DMT family transporter n=1 Tax=Dokdonella sp. TaxID=2291710 RepID=UPI0025BF3696|nr:EamA family transporter [Dokdonella sp.]MBZ0223303.1 EamA family transporter [Dokdonella sp.]MCC7256265.1 EamA family transporter [Dokdonella sp.]
MRRFYLIGFLVLVCFDTFAQVCFKLTANHALPPEANLAWVLRVASSPWVYAAIACYIGAFITWMALLEHAPIGPAFAASHLEVVSVLALSVVIFNERISAAQLIGSALIIAGIVCLAISETDAEKPPADA